jgi:hypothetical protein
VTVTATTSTSPIAIINSTTIAVTVNHP